MRNIIIKSSALFLAAVILLIGVMENNEDPPTKRQKSTIATKIKTVAFTKKYNPHHGIANRPAINGGTEYCTDATTPAFSHTYTPTSNKFQVWSKGTVF